MLEFLLPSGLLEGEPPSWYVVVGPDSLSSQPYDGTPRRAVPGESARIFILEPGGESDVFVSSYGASLGYITDAWYNSRESAIEAIAREYGADVGPWRPIPAEQDVPERFVLATLAQGHP